MHQVTAEKLQDIIEWAWMKMTKTRTISTLRGKLSDQHFYISDEPIWMFAQCNPHRHRLGCVVYNTVSYPSWPLTIYELFYFQSNRGVKMHQGFTLATRKKLTLHLLPHFRQSPQGQQFHWQCATRKTKPQTCRD